MGIQQMFLSGGGPAGPLDVTGGTTTSAGIEPGNGYKYHIFTANGNFVVNSGSGPVEYLIVGGGGDAGAKGQHGGGGGGGGVRTNVSGDPRAGAAVEVSSGTYAVVVGPGGAGNTVPATSGAKGSDSSIAFPSPLVSQGGGTGGYTSISRNPPSIRSGGSGGGGRNSGTSELTGGYGGYGAGPGSSNPSPVRQGYDGGDGMEYSSPWNSGYNPTGYTGGGGGGAGGEGQDASPGSGGSGDGGNGYPISVFAAPLIAPEIPGPSRPAWSAAVGPTGLYGGGGGGGGYYHAGPISGAGGPGGGGGDSPRGSAANPGVTYTGGGGSATIAGTTPGQDGQAINPGAGGAGLVVIRYAV